MLRFATLLLIVLTVCGNSPAFGFDLADGLVAHYPLDGNAQDISGNNNHGLPNSTAVPTTDRFGNPNSAYHFNGTNSQIVIPGSTSLDSPSAASTQFAWIRLEGFSQVGSNFGPILMKSTSTTNAFMYRLDVSSGGFGVAFGNWYTSAGASYSTPLETWFNIAATWDGQTARFYVNGLFIGEDDVTASLTADGRDLVIGADYPGAYESFWGKIDDVRVYNRALSDEEIIELGGGEFSPVAYGRSGGIEVSSGYPNPFSSSTFISFRVPENSSVAIEVFDLAGRLVRRLEPGEMVSGESSFRWDGRSDGGQLAPSGIYHYRLTTTAGRQATGRMVL